MGIGYDVMRMGLSAAAHHNAAQAGRQETIQRTAAERAAERKADAEARNMPPPLSEIARFIARYVDAPPQYIDAMTLIAAQSHALDDLVTTCRVLFTAEVPQSGKTEAMMLLATLCEDAYDTDTTPYALTSTLAANANSGINHAPTLYYDDISKLFGEGGTRGLGNPIYKILAKGYKKRSKSAWSVDRSRQEFSIYSTFLMSGLKTAVPKDIRTRSIVFQMAPGRPRSYFDERTAAPEADQLRDVLHRWVRGQSDVIRAFRARGLHPKLEGRRLEIWEGPFAAAYAASLQEGTPEWLNRCMAAFMELALDEADMLPLTPAQEVLRDLAWAVEHRFAGQRFIGGRALAEELQRCAGEVPGGGERYEDVTTHAVACIVRDALPFPSKQVRRPEYGGSPVRGYFAGDILAEWDKIRPGYTLDVEIPEEDDPFALTEDDDTDAQPYHSVTDEMITSDPLSGGVTDATDVTDSSAPTASLDGVPSTT
jgi:hypothetical protein